VLTQDVLTVLRALVSCAEARGAIGTEVVGQDVRTEVLQAVTADELGTRFGRVIRDCVRSGYVDHNGDTRRAEHRTRLTRNGLQVLQVLRLHD